MSKKFQEVMSFLNIYKAGKKSCKNVRWKPSVQRFENNLFLETYTLYQQLNLKKYKARKHNYFSKCERGKRRNIEGIHITERAVQRCFCDNYLTEKLTKTFIYDNGACMKGKGTQFAKIRLKNHLHKFISKNKEGYILLYDIHNFFNSINREKLINKVRKYIDDNDLFDLYSYFVNNTINKTGISLGSHVSQVSALFYVSSLDHHIKDNLKFKFYGRYMDDGYIFHKSKQKLAGLKNIIKEKLLELDLDINENKTQIVKLNKSFTFMKRKYTIYENNKIVVDPSKSNILRYRRKYKKLVIKKVSEDSLNILTGTFKGYLKEFNYFDRYTPKIKKELICIV